jgi:APA family basic amino acid/polyamine antiporter
MMPAIDDAYKIESTVSYRVLGYPGTPIFFLVTVGLLLILLMMGNPLRSLMGVGVVALGVPVYWLLFRRNKPGASSSSPAGE